MNATTPARLLPGMLAAAALAAALAHAGAAAGPRPAGLARACEGSFARAGDDDSVRAAGAVRADAGQRGRRRRGARGARVKTMPLKVGEWGGPQAKLVARADGASVEFECARGEVEGPLRPDAAGRFHAVGTYVRQAGGASRVEADAPDSAPAAAGESLRARFSGAVEGRSMTLTVVLVESGAEVGTFRLRFGEPSTLVRCH